jgi:hypothetical protein
LKNIKTPWRNLRYTFCCGKSYVFERNLTNVIATGANTKNLYKMTDNNPFLALFSKEVGNPNVTSVSDAPRQDCHNIPKQDNGRFNEFAENVFRLTLKPQQMKNSTLFYMKDLSKALNQECFDQTALDQAVLEYAVGLQNSLVNYLFQCYERSITHGDEPEIHDVRKTIFVNLDLAFSQPELFPEQNLHEDFLQLLAFSSEDTSTFLDSFVQHLLAPENPASVTEVFLPLFASLKTKLTNMHLLMGNQSELDAMMVLSKQPTLAKDMVSISILNENIIGKVGKQCEQTLLGSLFLCSCIPRVPGTPSDFFDRPSRSPPGVHATTEGNIWSASERIMDKVYKIFYNLFKSSPEVQNLTRKWLGNFNLFIEH